MSNGRAQGRSASLTPLVSVVIPSYNHARFVGQAIWSVEQQTYPHVELVVVDDGSSDGSGRLIERQLADSHLARVFYREHPNLGAAATIDRGVMLSSGEYVAILNSDDTFTPDRVERLMRQVTGRS
ncbi:MAG: glycosyltransferase family 2 protein, partial [Chloroflexi bacterium]|nr:glycosyltransferase family 2 protein [Chloroflexota bacterium]